MNRKELALVVGLPLAILFEALTSYLGNKYFDILEANPLYFGIEGTWNTLVLGGLISILLFKVMLKQAEDYELLDFPRGMIYKTLLFLFILCLVSNVHGMITG